MQLKRYTVVLADRTTGVVRRFTIARAAVLLIVLGAVTLPVLVALGARQGALNELGQLRSANARLTLENDSYRSITGELTTQITSLRTAITDLGDRANLDPATLRAVERLPSVVKSRAVGGGRAVESAADMLAIATGSPQGSFGVLKDLLGILETRLESVRTSVEKREALAAATPSIWPAQGWLSDGYGSRRDPFTGQPDFHPALDISADRGDRVYATAAGTVRTAAYTGAYGNLVTIDHGFGLSTRYGHLVRFAVKPNERVNRGEVIGYIGATGRATGNHLHFEVWVDGKPVNPLRLLTKPHPE
jgi:murein DD-endopeptidase MepM/ murein hydrolase activator NlpD